MKLFLPRFQFPHPFICILVGAVGAFVGAFLDRGFVVEVGPATWGSLAAAVGASVGLFALIRRQYLR
jgi:uncharacterized membrane protein YeaQ/YmgE (transglycosylase-associated protein family)